MGKTVSAADMLSAGRRRSSREPEPQAQERLDAQTPSRSDAQTLQRPDAQTPERLDNMESEQPGDQATKRLDGEAPKRPNAQTPERLDDTEFEQPGDQATKRLGVGAIEQSNIQTPSRSDAQTSERLGFSAVRTLDVTATRRLEAPPTFQRSTVFFTPEQRQWIKRTTKDLPDGLSMSDVVRLAVGRLIVDVTHGLDLAPALAAQAHADAQIFVGRRNRGLPPEAGEQSA